MWIHYQNSESTLFVEGELFLGKGDLEDAYSVGGYYRFKAVMGV